MRQIYTSQRLQNIDRVVAMMAEAGIQTSVTNRRVYAGHDYKGPSYSARADPATWPQVWVVRSEDQPRARALLREAGIEPPTRYADELAQSREQSPEQRRMAISWSLRTVLLGAIALIILLNWLGILHIF
ncbi:MAG: hypothetical protein ACREPT_10755 [Rudaea sp.]